MRRRGVSNREARPKLFSNRYSALEAVLALADLGEHGGGSGALHADGFGNGGIVSAQERIGRLLLAERRGNRRFARGARLFDRRGARFQRGVVRIDGQGEARV